MVIYFMLTSVHWHLDSTYHSADEHENDKREKFQTLRNVGTSEECIGFISKLLAYDPQERLSIDQALLHPWITGGLSHWVNGGMVPASSSPRTPLRATASMPTLGAPNLGLSTSGSPGKLERCSQSFAVLNIDSSPKPLPSVETNTPRHTPRSENVATEASRAAARHGSPTPGSAKRKAVVLEAIEESTSQAGRNVKTKAHLAPAIGLIKVGDSGTILADSESARIQKRLSRRF